MKQRNRRIVLVMLVVVFITGFALIMTFFNKEEKPWSPTFSTHYTDRFGLDALYRILDQRKYKVDKNYHAMNEREGSTDETLIIMAPMEPLFSEELEKLKSLVSEGMWALVVESSGNSILEKFKVEQRIPDSVSHYERGEVIPEQASPSPLIRKEMKLKFMPREIPDEFMFKNINDRFSYHLGSEDVMIPVLAYNGEVVMAWIPWGKGRICVVTHPWMFTNKGLTESDNLEFVTGLFDQMQAYHPGPIIFDEYHHGFHVKTISTPLSRPEVRIMIAGLFITFVLAIISLGRRKARPVPIHVEPRRNVREFLEAMANIYRRKGGEWYLFEDIAKRFTARLQLSLGFSDPKEIYNRNGLMAAAARKWGEPEAQRLSGIIASLRNTGPNAPSGTLLDLSRQIREFSIRNKMEHHAGKDSDH